MLPVGIAKLAFELTWKFSLKNAEVVKEIEQALFFDSVLSYSCNDREIKWAPLWGIPLNILINDLIAIKLLRTNGHVPNLQLAIRKTK